MASGTEKVYNLESRRFGRGKFFLKRAFCGYKRRIEVE
jgi:hypothetical protein